MVNFFVLAAGLRLRFLFIMRWINLIAAAVVLVFVEPRTASAAARSFTIDYDNNTFLKDGKPFRYISGSLHYARVHPKYWQDRLTKIYMAGLDAVQIYVPWNFHEPSQGVFNFEAGADLESFLQMAQASGLLVILRAGPYICGEWDMGGLPSWLLKDRGIKLRTSDPEYLKYVDLWLGVLLPKIKPHLYGNGGPVITVQIENEYGSYPACDHGYMQHLLSQFQAHLGKDVVFFTTDGPSQRLLECGSLNGIYATVDFGAGGDPGAYFAEQRKFSPKGPLVNSEYYTGWLDHWGSPHQTRKTTEIVDSLDKILKLGANINMYMFEGGTNFAYWNGANGNEATYSPQPTSYDYDAPLTEAGDPNEKYLSIRTLIGKYKKLPPGKIPPPTPKYPYGKTDMHRIATLYEALRAVSPSGPVYTDYPMSMEDLHQDFGFMLYRTQLKANYAKPTPLQVPGIRDRGYVMVDKKPVGILQRNTHISLNITGHVNSTLDILVENMGRLNYGCCINDTKGIISNVTLNDVILESWQIYSLNLSKAHLEAVAMTMLKTIDDEPTGPLEVPSFYIGTLPSGPAGGPQDTFLKMPGWSKGQAFINGFNLGRYWPAEGPQITLYVPAFVLTATTNTLVLFETEHSPCYTSKPACSVEFVNKPILNSTIPPLGDRFIVPRETEIEKLDIIKDFDLIDEEIFEWESMALSDLDSSESGAESSEYEVSDPQWVVDEIPDPVEGPESDTGVKDDCENNKNEDKSFLGVVKDIVLSVVQIFAYFTCVPVLAWSYF